VTLTKIIRNGMAAALIAAVPATGAFAATRPNAAIPMASSAAVAAQYDDQGSAGLPWVAYAAVGLAIGVALWLALDNNGDGSGALSRA
jgi:hypothetical protein